MIAHGPTPARATGASAVGPAQRLGLLRDRLGAIAPEGPEGLGAIRGELEELQAELEGGPGEVLARPLQRLALLTEVWECLAVERPESARAVAAFCLRALEQLGHAAATDDADEHDRVDTRWILDESSACWRDYLALIDPDGSPDPGAPGDRPFEDDGPVAGSPEPFPAIDPATLVRLLSERTRGVPTEAIPGTGSEPSGLPVPGPAGEARTAVEAGDGPLRPSSPEPFPFASADPSSRNRSENVRLAGVPPRDGTASLERLVEEVPGRTRARAALDIDPECREAFLAEADDLFERIGTLVLDLRVGNGQEGVLHELGRCFHTLKGAAGSVGLKDLAARIHHLEQGLEDAAGAISPGLLERLHGCLGHLEEVLDTLRRGAGPGPFPEPFAEIPAATAARPRTVDPSPAPACEAEGPPAIAAATGAEPSDGPIRVPSGRMDELMDLASELIMRRGAWAAQAERLKGLARQIGDARNELQARLDQLTELGIGPMPESGVRGHGTAAIVLRLAEQAEDLVVLSEAARAQALPLADESDALARLTLQLWESLQSIRIVPVRGLFQRLARVAHDAARIEGRDVEVSMIGDETGLDRAVQDKAYEPLLHVVRNAVGHGIEPADERIAAGKARTGRVTLEACREGGTLVLSVADDGRGLDYEAIAAKGRRLGLIRPDDPAGPDQLGALIFRPGFSTRDEANAVAGRGVGMDVVAQEVRRLRGTLELTSRACRGTRITLRLPARLALEQALIARAAGRALAIPISLVEHAQPLEPGDVGGEPPHATVRIRDRSVPLVYAHEILGFSANAAAACPKLLLVRAEGGALALVFDAIEGTRELVIRPLGPLLAGHPVIGGTSLSLTGEVIFVLNPSGLFRWHAEGRFAGASRTSEPTSRPAPVLVVDDSISVRRVVTRQLRMLGLEVDEVSDGVEALGKLASRAYSMVLTDLEMPRMDGFELLAELRRSPALSGLPVVVASTESRPATRRRALALGARAFLPKPIDQDDLARVAGALLNRAGGVGAGA